MGRSGLYPTVYAILLTGKPKQVVSHELGLLIHCQMKSSPDAVEGVLLERIIAGAGG